MSPRPVFKRRWHFFESVECAIGNAHIRPICLLRSKIDFYGAALNMNEERSEHTLGKGHCPFQLVGFGILKSCRNGKNSERRTPLPLHRRSNGSCTTHTLMVQS